MTAATLANAGTITIGILGSGQLGRMLAIAAAQLGIKTHIYAPDAADSPAAQVATYSTTAEYDDHAALRVFAGGVDVVTTEFENVPAETMSVISEFCPASPGQAALKTAQHRIKEKSLADELGIATPRFWHVRHADDLAKAMAELQGPGILKTCRLGYDGKGQIRISPQDDANTTMSALGSDDAILEEMVEFDCEISCLIARDRAGKIQHFPPTQNRHEAGILAQSVAPAPILPLLADNAMQATATLAESLNLFGVLAVEFFIARDGRLLFNEMAPRPHNSFHWTIEGSETSQFTQLARTLAGLGFGGTKSYGRWLMDNLLGQHMDQVPDLLATSGVHLHLYGKPQARDGRKMGHATRQITI